MSLANHLPAMATRFYCLLSVFLLLSFAAQAEDTQQQSTVTGDVLYKGVVGKMLDAVPMDPKDRVALQQTNAVVSSTATSRTLLTWAGLTNPILLITGLAWGMFSASNIKAAAVKQPNADPNRAARAKLWAEQVALLIVPPPMPPEAGTEGNQ